jgi:Zn-dependent peptidase ImmA (M78 family)
MRGVAIGVALASSASGQFDLANGTSGMTQWLKQQSHWLKAINRDDSQTRRRFTLGHEFKHILDNPYINVLYPKSEQSDDDRGERMCDYFAACLLMPRPWVKRLWAQGVQDAAVLAATFNVSPAAMNRRLQDLGLVETRERWRGQVVARYFRKAPANAVLVTN